MGTFASVLERIEAFGKLLKAFRAFGERMEAFWQAGKHNPIWCVWYVCSIKNKNQGFGGVWLERLEAAWGV